MDRGTIVVGYDGSPLAEVALQWAAETGALETYSVRALIVDEDEDSPQDDQDGKLDDEMPARVEAVLAAAGVSGTAERHVGQAAPLLLEQSLDADMLVVGSHGHGWAAETVLGSVSQHLARHARCPVIVVRQPARPDATRIVVGVDGSEESRAALEFACRRARLTNETVVALHAWKPGRVDIDRHGQLPRSVGERAQSAEEAVTEYVAGFDTIVTLEKETIGIPPALALTEASANASLVVTGSRGRGVATGVLLGSVSHYVLHQAHCPVAVVR